MRPHRVPLILSTLVLLAGATLAGDAPTPTFDDFLLRVAEAKGLDATDGATARADLARQGVALPDVAPRAPLTEAHVAAVSRSLGIAVRTRSPESPFASDSVERYFAVFGREIRSSGDPSAASESNEDTGPYPRPNEKAADPAERGKGKKKGLPVSPSAPL